ncbi:MAG: hypothetical protein ABH835_03740, partial [Patescibacteria group bacterium]
MPKKKTKQNKIARYIVYLLILGLLVFEFLNFIGILNYQASFTWTGLIVTIVMIFVGLQIIMYYTEHNFHVSLSNQTMIVVLIGIYLDAAADMFQLYDRFEWFDQVVHFNAGILLCLVLYWFISRLEKTKQIRLGPCLKSSFIFAATLTLGVTYEIEEYLEDFFTHSNRLGTGMDTANDMFMAAAGCI